MSATLQSTPRPVLDLGDFSPILPLPRPAHWLNYARPVYRFFAHPFVTMGAMSAIYILAALSLYGWLLLVML